MSSKLNRQPLFKYATVILIIAIIINVTHSEAVSYSSSAFYFLSLGLTIIQIFLFWKRMPIASIALTIPIFIIEISTGISTIISLISVVYGASILAYRHHKKSLVALIVVDLLFNTILTTPHNDVLEYISLIVSNYAAITLAILFAIFLRKINLDSLTTTVKQETLGGLLFSCLLGHLFPEIRAGLTEIENTCSQGQELNISNQKIINIILSIQNKINIFEPYSTIYNANIPETEDYLFYLKTELQKLGYKVIVNNFSSSAPTVDVEKLIWCAVIGQEVTQFLDKSKSIQLKLDLTESEVSRKLVLRYKAKAATMSTINNENIDYLLESFLDYFKIIREVDRSLDNQMTVTVTVPKSFS